MKRTPAKLKENVLTVSAPRAAELLGVSLTTIKKGMREGKIPTVTIAKRKLVSMPPLLRMLGAA
jgi:hypothetical protein